MRFVWLIISVYALVVLAAYFLQYRMLYFPDRISMADVREQATVADLVLWASSDADYRGLIREKEGGDHRGTILVFHGNAGSAVHRSYYTDALVPLGYRVILLEYPGYGGRPGKLGESSFVADAEASMGLALKQFGGPLFLWGESLGCGVAAALSSSSEAVKGVILLTPWDSLTNVAQALYRFLPVGLLLKDRYDSVTHMGGFRGPVAVVMAGRDEVIANRFTKNLYELLASSKRMWLFEDAGHSSWPSAPDLAWWREVMKFVDIS